MLFLFSFYVLTTYSGCWTLDLLSDSYFKETSWEIRSNGTTLTSGNYFGFQDCLNFNGCIELEIFDSASDGFCCRYGQGFANLYHDDALVWSSENLPFASSLSSNLICPGDLYTPAANVDESRREQCLTLQVVPDDGSDPSEISYAMTDVSTGSTLATGSSSFSDCLYITDSTHISILDSGGEGDASIYVYLGGQLSQNISSTFGPGFDLFVSPLTNCISLDLTPDAYTTVETTWSLIDDSTGFKLASSEVIGDTLSTFSCFPIADCLTLRIIDTGGDGVCCNYGDGFFKVSFNSFEIGYLTEFGQSAELQICASEYASYGERCYSDPVAGTLAGCVDDDCTSYDHKWEALQACILDEECGGITWGRQCDPCNYQLRQSSTVEESDSGETSITIEPCASDAIHGEFGEWTEWGECSSDSLSYRLRACQEPRAENGGRDCFGNYIEEKDCANAGTSVTAEPRPTTGTCVRFSITPDNYPRETSWEVTDSDGVVLLSEKFTRLTTSGGIDECLYLAPGECVRLTVYDSGSDGLCCTYGEGEIQAYMDGILVWVPSNLQFGASIWYELCSGAEAVTSLQPEECLSATIVPDSSPEDISWVLTSASGATLAAGNNGTSLECFDMSSESECLTFEISDPDGFCCENGLGYYTVRAGVNSIHSSDGNFTSQSTEICPDDYVAPNEVCVDLIISPDDYFRETDWLVTSADGTVLGYGEGDNRYSGFSCISISESCVYVTVTDSHGDGFSTGGSITIQVDGVVTYYNDHFDSDSVTTMVCPTDGQETEIAPEDCVYLTIVPDHYAHHETTWIMRDGQGMFLASGDYTGLTTCEVGMTDSCVSVELYDSMADGLCCDYGEGSYEISVGNIPVHRSDGKFANGEVFTICPGSYALPSLSPTVGPIETPEGPCLNVTIVPDAYPEDISWELRSNATKRTILSSGDDPLAGIECYPLAECLEFILYDSDGLCCEYGIGFYTVYLDQHRIAFGDGDFDGQTSTVVCPADYPTQTTDPVCLQVIVSPDYYPRETSWEVKYDGLDKVIHSGYYNSVFDTTLHTEECLPVQYGLCLEITFFDDDGFCCGYGVGSYEIRYGGAVYTVKNATFKGELTVELCPDELVCDENLPHDCHLFPTGTPSISPSKSTFSPSTAPSGSPVSSVPSRPPSPEPSASTGTPTVSPTIGTKPPSRGPTPSPETVPTTSPTSAPTTSPSPWPSFAPTESPTEMPTQSPTESPTDFICGGYTQEQLSPNNFRTVVQFLNAGALVFDVRSEQQVLETGKRPGSYDIPAADIVGIDLEPYTHGDPDTPIILFGDDPEVVDAYNYIYGSGYSCTMYLTDYIFLPDFNDWVSSCELDSSLRTDLIEEGLSEDFVEFLCVRDNEFMVTESGFLYPTCIAHGFFDEQCNSEQLVCLGEGESTYGVISAQAAQLQSLTTPWRDPSCPEAVDFEVQSALVFKVCSKPREASQNGVFNVTIDVQIEWMSVLPLPWEYIPDDVIIDAPHLDGKIVSDNFELTECTYDYSARTCTQYGYLNITTQLICDISGNFTFTLWARPMGENTPDVQNSMTFQVGATPACAIDFGTVSLESNVATYSDDAYSIPETQFPIWSTVYMRIQTLSPYRTIVGVDILKFTFVQPEENVYHELWKEGRPALWGEDASLTVSTETIPGGLNIDTAFRIHGDEIIIPSTNSSSAHICVEFNVIYESAKSRRYLLTQGLSDRGESNVDIRLVSALSEDAQTSSPREDSLPVVILGLVCTMALVMLVILIFVWKKRSSRDSYEFGRIDHQSKVPAT